MKTRLALLSSLALAASAFAASDSAPQATPSGLDATQKLEKIMVTGSLETPANAETKLEKVMVTGSLASSTNEEVLPKIMVTGSLENPANSEVKLEKYMVTGSMESKPALRRQHRK